MSNKIIVLAAGKGTRMKSKLPKVLHPIAGVPMLQHVINRVKSLQPEQIYTVIGHGAEEVVARIEGPVTWVKQTEQLGTGHAVQQALAEIEPDDRVLIAYGDVPLTEVETFNRLHSLSSEKTIGLLSVDLQHPKGYGRIVRDDNGAVQSIVEEKDATEAQKLITEVNTGMLSIKGDVLHRLLSNINNDNAQGEYYLTDIFALAVAEGISIETVHPAHEWEVAGVNSRAQLAELERIHQRNIADSLMAEGVTLTDPSRIDVRGELKVGQDVTIDVNAVFVGTVELADGVVIGAGCHITNSSIAADTVIKPNSVIENANVGASCSIGPFARLRPGTQLADDSHVGNFVEIKNANLGTGSKVNHLSYVGDADVGSRVNVGAGTITCNYDGAFKHRTVLDDDVFIGSNSSLVAPVHIKSNATIGAGSVISRDVESQQLALTRSKQKHIDNWERPKKPTK